MRPRLFPLLVALALVVLAQLMLLGCGFDAPAAGRSI